MRHQNSVLHDVLNHIPRAAFDRLVEEHQTDARVWSFRSKDHLIASLYGQLAGAKSIREITIRLESHGCPVRNCCTKRTALILLGSDVWRRHRTRKGNAVRHQNSVLHDVLKHIPWAAFDRLVEEHQTDARVRSFRSKDHLIALLYGQLAGAKSIREITTGLESHAPRLYHLGARTVARSTFADANTTRSYTLFADLFAIMVQQAGRGMRRTIGEVVHLIDSTTVSLSALSAGWARFSHNTCGAKLHLVLDPDADRPVYADITPCRVNDITAAQAMPITPGATYVFDLGYYDFAWWAKLDAAQCRIVTRLKANTPLAIVGELDLPEDAPVQGEILSDRIGHLPERLTRSRCNPFQNPVREIQLGLEIGKVLRIVSNDLDASAQEIAGLYKRRCAIELFFG